MGTLFSLLAIVSERMKARSRFCYRYLTAAEMSINASGGHQ